ncbi:MAG TPA: TlyA family rRNA (cytidine-2'-O)-methyltransferase [Ruminococcaceae bacterium]|nr:TlyA family rRNA (cytidine-2'-O)-methyltransferase [Oscillospiraceae bacterium]
MPEKIRLDTALFERGLVSSREKAKALVMAGEVYLNGVRAEKPGVQTVEKDIIEVRSKGMPYVSRGGYKLEKALRVFQLDLNGVTAADIGASTGGFTDCMLQNGAAKIYAVDVGYGQLDWKLRSDSRVVSLERTNFRYITPEQIPEPLDFASADVSFISLDLILPALFPLQRPGAMAVCLIKPQFEAGKEKVGKKGVVREPSVHREVTEHVTDFSVKHGYSALALDFSPVRGPQGNIEYLLLLSKDGRQKNEISAQDIQSVVTAAHNMEI